MGDVEDLEMTPVSRHAQVDHVLEPEELDTVNMLFVPRDRNPFLIRRANTKQSKLLLSLDFPTFKLSCPQIRDHHFCIPCSGFRIVKLSLRQQTKGREVV